ncbi:MAG: Cell wall protein [Nocardia sp.]|uniref:Hsp70 family protein n=1 Tax=Nocardia sp. TaxID=1821 RepID=UPI002611B59C|nr:Hsp70 family protein [Nocardia sp.]MCU1642101.1 Cell wall protein [Nocardia sp.]
MSIGTVNSVWATAAGGSNRPAVRVRRTAVTFDSAGGARIGGIPRFAPVVTDFADLTADPDPVVIGGRIWSPADLIAAVVNGFIETNAPEAPAVTTYPACYTDKHVTRLRRALDWSGAADVMLMPESVAAVEWLDNEYGISSSGITLVYDLGGNCLDVSVVRTEADREERGILGYAERSYDYGGRPLGALLARYARSIAPDAAQPVSAVVSASDTNRLRSWHIRNSLRVVRACVHQTGLAMEDVDRVLLIGGASRPIEVARVLADLGRPVIMSPDPAHTVAVGAAIAAFRSVDTGSAIGRYAPRAAVFSGAAVASALAMSAATVLGGPVAGPPTLQAAPGTDAGGAALGAGDVLLLEDATPAPDGMVRVHRVVTAAVITSYGPMPATVTQNWTAGHPVDTGPGGHCETRVVEDVPTYANPAQFINPLPFASPFLLGTYPGQIPSVSLPRTLPGPPAQPGNSAPQPGQSAPGAPGTAPGGTDSGGTAPASPGTTIGGGTTTGGTGGETSPGGTTSGAGGTTGGGTTAGGGTTTGGTTTGGTTTGGSTTGGTTSGASTGGGTTGGSTTGGGTTGGSTTGGGTTGGSTTGGGTTGGSTTGGGTTGGSTTGGGTTSGGGATTGGGTTGGGSTTGGGTSGGSTSGGSTTGGGTTGGGTTSGGGATGGGTTSGGGTSAGGGGATSGGGMGGGGATGGGGGGAAHGGGTGGGAGGGGAGGGGGHGGGGGGGGHR